jgi:cell division protein FtsW (lipid II flippase)
MKDRDWFSQWRRVAEYLLEAADVEQIIAPTIADAVLERPSASGTRAWLWRSQWHLLSAIVAAMTSSTTRRIQAASGLAFFALALAGFSGAAVFRHGPMPQLALKQCLFVGIGAVAAVFVLAVPPRLLHTLGTTTVVLGLLGLVACQWVGVALDGQRQWLRIGSLQIHVATLCLPAFVTFLRRAKAARSVVWTALGVLTTLGLLLLQGNTEAVLVFALTTCVAVIEVRGKWLSWVLASLLVMSCGVAMTSTSLTSLWSTLGVAALALALGWGVHQGMLRTRTVTPATQTLSVAMVSLMAWRSFGREPLPVVGFGGSAMVAFFVLLALQMRATRAVTAGPRPV